MKYRLLLETLHEVTLAVLAQYMTQTS